MANVAFYIHIAIYLFLGRNSANPEILLIPGAGGIFLSRPLDLGHSFSQYGLPAW